MTYCMCYPSMANAALIMTAITIILILPLVWSLAIKNQVCESNICFFFFPLWKSLSGCDIRICRNTKIHVCDRVSFSVLGYGRYESAGSGEKKNMSQGNWIHPATNQP